MKHFKISLVDTAFLTTLVFFASSGSAHAYIGPGAGFAFITTGIVFLLIPVLAVFLFLLWPVRLAWRFLTGKRAHKRGHKGRVVIVGLDGLDPGRAESMMEKGLLPNLAEIAKKGAFRRLETTTPAISPVAWSSFQTGVNPASHNVYDFLTPDRRTYLPLLSSAHIGEARKTLSIGKYRIPLTKPELRLNRKSKPFWTILGEHYIFSSIIRVPITFPPEKFNGVLLSAMCAPDLRGTQGTFSFFTDDPDASSIYAGGDLTKVEKSGGEIIAELKGPENTLVEDGGVMIVPIAVSMNGNGSTRVKIGDEKLELGVGESSDWVKVEFKAGLGVKVSGICRLFLKSLEPHFGLYVSPIHIDPDSPALPISHPVYYSTYLAKLIGPYATLGLAEDTWALNERVLTEDAFLEQCWRHHDEREKMLMDAIDHTPRGCVVCVFDATDRIQHMFSRYLDPEHPANRGKSADAHKDAIDNLYKRCDELIGRVRDKLNDEDILMVMSDHGFKVFKRGINLNSWLRKEGYLELKNGAESSEEWFKQVDWDNTRAYSLGLGGIYINKKGREKHGTVEPGEESQKLTEEIAAKLRGLADPHTGETAVANAHMARDKYTGPYADNAPDIVVGCADGYRASWDGVTGVVNDTVFEDNEKSWSGDHCVDPALVPGVLFSNRPIGDDKPRIIDIAPTVLQIFGVEKPKYMDGEPLDLKVM